MPNMMAPVIQYPEHLTSLQNFHNIVGRLRPGVSESQAVAEMEVIGRRVAAAFPDPMITQPGRDGGITRTIHVDPGTTPNPSSYFSAHLVILPHRLRQHCRSSSQ